MNLDQLNAKFEEMRAMLHALGANVPPSMTMPAESPRRKATVEDITDLPEAQSGEWANVEPPVEPVDESGLVDDTSASMAASDSPPTSPAAASGSSAGESPAECPSNPLRLYTYREIHRYLSEKHKSAAITISVRSGDISFEVGAIVHFVIDDKVVAAARLQNSGKLVSVNDSMEIFLVVLFSNFIEPEAVSADVSTSPQ